MSNNPPNSKTLELLYDEIVRINDECTNINISLISKDNNIMFDVAIIIAIISLPIQLYSILNI